MEDLLDEVDQALRARGLSARHASIQVAGHGDFVRNLRRGSVDSLRKFRALCVLLGLEFYVGPPRDVGSVDRQRLLAAMDATDRVLREDVSLRELDLHRKAGVVAAVYDLLGDVSMVPDAPQVLVRIRRLIQASMGVARWRSEPPKR